MLQALCIVAPGDITKCLRDSRDVCSLYFKKGGHLLFFVYLSPAIAAILHNKIYGI